MKQKQTFFLFLLYSLFCTFSLSFAQNNDSLWKIYKNKNKHDTTRLEAIHNIARSYVHTNPDTAIILAQQELQLSKDKNQKKWRAKAFNTMGLSFQYKSDYPRALDYHFRSLKIMEELANKKGIANSLNNIGNIYRNLSDYPKAIAYHLKSLKTQEAIGNLEGVAYSLNNIGNVYFSSQDNNKALDYYLRSLKLDEVLGDKKGIANSLANIGSTYGNLSNYSKAFDYQLQSLKIYEELEDKYGMASLLGNMSLLYLKQKQYTSALQYSTKALQLAKEIGDLDLEKEIQNTLYKAYKATNNTSQALEHYERFILLRDSIFKEENQKQIMRKEMNYEYEKKEAISKLEQDKKEAISKEEKQKQRIILISVIAGLLLVIVFSIFLYNRFRITQKQKSIIEKQKLLVDEANEELNQQNEEISSQRDEIENQKHLIEEHQKETIDSITYAKRIQDAILPPIESIKEKFNSPLLGRGAGGEVFVLYKPKDIVAGDFYWMEEIDNIILIAAADCTGHGVPGAMVSVVCSNALNRAVKEFKLKETGKILDKVTDLVLETFEKSIADVKDGMDISLLAINKKTKQINWSGANNPLWYFEPTPSPSKEGSYGLVEITANKQPIGKSDHRKPFTTHTIEYKSGTTFYLFTDGYADQFGGPKGKKYKYKQFQETLSSSLKDEMNIQQTTLNNSFEIWRGELEQVDDVCVIGIRV